MAERVPFKESETVIDNGALEQRADEIIDTVIQAVSEINKQINKGLSEEGGGSLGDQAHEKNQLDEAHIGLLELRYPVTTPLIAMLEYLEGSLFETVRRFIDTGTLNPDDREKIKNALVEDLRRRQGVDK